MSVEVMFCSQRPVESRRYDSSANEIIFHLLSFRNRRRISSLPKMMEVLVFAHILLGLGCLLLAILGRLVLHECLPIRTLILEVFLEVRCESLFNIIFVQIFLERLKSNSHLIHDPILKQLLFVLWKAEVSFHICP